MLPTDEMSKMLLANYFILYKPRDIVSGDFYWTTIKKEWLYLAVADCTGHGVPGAFMSMLGISLLNEIIAQHETIKANHFLEKLRELVIRSLKQSSYKNLPESENSKQISTSIKDGMDIGLVAINLETYQMQFSGANNPLYLNQNGEIKEIKGDKMPIAIYERMTEYENHEIQLNRGDIFYLTSDGYADQFGGKDNKKLYKKNLLTYLAEIGTHELNMQQELLEQKLNDWKGKNDQTDDITIIGVKI
jgi:serine phosphatase RsbU (regulator of sigma subunit)